MPLYEFENEQHGVTVLLPMAVAERKEKIVLKRRQVPSRVTVGVGAAAPTMSDKLRQGYKALEAGGQLRETGGNYLPLDTVKRTLAEPDTE